MNSAVNPISRSDIQSRIKLYEFSTGKQTFFEWQAGMLPKKSGAKVLELGCGDGALWQSLLPRWSDCSLTLTDVSDELVGVAAEFVGKLAEGLAATVVCETVNFNDIPYADESFDVVIANHNLFYASDLDHVLENIRRILAPGGQLICSTVGADHLHEIVNLLRTQNPSLLWEHENLANRFGLENGAKKLMRWFEHVDQFEYDNNLHVKSVNPLMAYIAKAFKRNMSHWIEDNETKIESLFASEFNQRGYVRLTPHSGFFIAKKAGS